MNYTKDNLTREIQGIQRQRRESWKKVWGEEDKFVEPIQQKAYDKMSEVLAILQIMTEAEFAIFQKRVDASVMENSAIQTSLF